MTPSPDDMAEKKPTAYRLVRENRKARFKYEILEKVEAGVSLLGTEVKSIRQGQVNLDEAYARVRNGEMYLVGMNVSPYSHAGRAFNHEPGRARKLLLHRREIDRLAGKVQQRGHTLVPLRLYFNERGLLKVEIALARGRSRYDKREKLRKEEVERRLRRYRR